jgi:ABC-type transport system involved in cytochrome c biogenesis permease subunit
VAISVLVLVVAGYAAVATSYLEARRRREAPPLWARLAGPLAVAAHLGGLFALSAVIDRSPFSNGSQALSFLAFSLAGLYLLLEATSRVATHGGGFYVVAALLGALSVPGLVATPAGAAQFPKDAVRTIHVGLALLGTAAVLAAGLLGGGYLGAYRRVKRHRIRGGAEGPSLKGFERLERAASFLAVLLLAPALALGVAAVLKEDAPRSTPYLVGLTAVVFAFVAAAGWIWWRKPLRGRLAAWLNLAGTILVILALVVVHPLVLGHAG